MASAATLADLKARITASFEGGGLDEAAVHETLALLDKGEIRVAEPGDDGWIVHAWIKQAVLLCFRVYQMKEDGWGDYRFHDKVPLKTDLAAQGVRVVPPGTVRYGSFLEPGCIVMPGYVNIGAYVGAGSMVDTWATVGSCAQIGKGVHLSGGVGIGGVLEPPGATPVIIEDGAFVGSRAIVVEGVHVGRRGRDRRRGRADGLHEDPRRHGPRGGRPPGPHPAALRRHPGHPHQVLPGRRLRRALRADHRRAQGEHRPQDLAQRRAARLRDRRVSVAAVEPGRRLSLGVRAALVVGALCVVFHLGTGWVAWRAGLLDGATEAFWSGRPLGVRAFLGARSTALVQQGEAWRLATAPVLHAGGGHLLSNLCGLAVLGWLWADRWPVLKLLACFVVGAVAGGLLAQLFQVPLGDGASGGLFAWLAALWVDRRQVPEEAHTRETRILGWVCIANLVLSLLWPPLDAAAHLGGALAGLVFPRAFQLPPLWSGTLTLWLLPLLWGVGSLLFT